MTRSLKTVILKTIVSSTSMQNKSTNLADIIYVYNTIGLHTANIVLTIDVYNGPRK